METSVRDGDGRSESDGLLRPLRTWAGHGTGATCNGCGGLIQPSEIEYEIELPEGSDARTLHFHFACYRSWVRR